MRRVADPSDTIPFTSLLAIRDNESIPLQFFSKADIVVEAVPEKVDLKHSVRLFVFDTRYPDSGR